MTDLIEKQQNTLSSAVNMELITQVLQLLNQQLQNQDPNSKQNLKLDATLLNLIQLQQ